MRFQDWDVLLFPRGSRTPLQEFKTQCFVTKDTDSPCLRIMMGPPSHHPLHGNPIHVPVLTSFIPSLYKDAAFRVSIHNWGKPQGSPLLINCKQPEDAVAFEARVYIDGVLSGNAFFGQRFESPYVIDFGNLLDQDGRRDTLRFPEFHREILDQRHWDAGDPFGRIKVVISEGIARVGPIFERFKDLLVMSFQHAPLHVLEHSGIAWPNPSLSLGSLPESGYNTATDFLIRKTDETAHGHSPTRSELRPLSSSLTRSTSCDRDTSFGAWATNRAFPVPATQLQRIVEERTWGFGPNSSIEPFIGDQGLDSIFNTEQAWTHRGARSSREDVAMPDYSISSGSRAISSSMTGVSYEHSKQPSMEAILDDDAYDAVIQSLTPTKPPIMGTRAPSNTPSAALAMASGAMSAPTKPSAATQLSQTRATKNARRNRRASALQEISQPSTRDVSSGNISSAQPEEKTTTPKLGMSPSGIIKGKKEAPKEDTKTSPKKTPQKDPIGDEVLQTNLRDENLREDEHSNEKEQEKGVHKDENIIEDISGRML